jgi:ankyrin repeat protein
MSLSPSFSSSPCLPLLNSPQEGATALIKAAHFGHLKIVRLLLDRGAEINRTDQVRFAHSSSGRCPLYYSQGTMIIFHNDVFCCFRCRHLSYACSHDFASSNLDKAGYSAILEAAIKGHTEVVSLLIDGGANIESIPRNVRTAHPTHSHPRHPTVHSSISLHQWRLRELGVRGALS